MAQTFRAEVGVVTPHRAAEWLLKNTKNRSVRQSVVDKMVRDMSAGRFWKGGAVIVFDVEDVLINGQHTLLAIMKSRVPVWCVVVYGADTEARLAVDSHTPRRKADSIQLAGHGAILSGFSGRKNTAASAYEHARIGATWSGGGACTASELVAFSEAHSDAGEWALTTFNQYRVPKVVTGPIIGAFIRAAEFYATRRQELRDAVAVLCTGNRIDPKDHEIRDVTMNTLRSSLIQGSATSGGSTSRTLAYRKTERAIQAYMSGVALSKIYDPRAELFPYPEESEESLSA